MIYGKEITDSKVGSAVASDATVQILMLKITLIKDWPSVYPITVIYGEEITDSKVGSAVASDNDVLGINNCRKIGLS